MFAAYHLVHVQVEVPMLLILPSLFHSVIVICTKCIQHMKQKGRFALKQPVQFNFQSSSLQA